jgi:hypothetical protein
MKPRTFKTLSIINAPNNRAFELVKDDEFAAQVKVSQCREIFIYIFDEMEFLKSSAWTTLSKKYKDIESSILISFDGSDKFQTGWRAKNKEKITSLAVDKEKHGFNPEIKEFYINYFKKSLNAGLTG